MNTLRETAEIFALNQWLSDAPCHLTYQEILAALESCDYPDHDIVVWEPIEDYSGEEIAEMIEDTRRAFERAAAQIKVVAIL
jgi:thiaminase